MNMKMFNSIQLKVERKKERDRQTTTKRKKDKGMFCLNQIEIIAKDRKTETKTERKTDRQT